MSNEKTDAICDQIAKKLGGIRDGNGHGGLGWGDVQDVSKLLKELAGAIKADLLKELGL